MSLGFPSSLQRSMQTRAFARNSQTSESATSGSSGPPPPPGRIIETVVNATEENQVVHNWPERTPVPRDPDTSTVDWLRGMFGVVHENEDPNANDLTCDLPPTDATSWSESDIKAWLTSDDINIRTAGQICWLYLTGYDGVTGLDGRHRDGVRIDKEDVAEPYECGIRQSYWQDWTPGDWNDFKNRPGEEINWINWADRVDRNREVIERTNWFKLNWKKADLDSMNKRSSLYVPKEYWDLIGQYIKRHLPTELHNGRLPTIQEWYVDDLIYNKDRVLHAAHTDDIHPTAEAYLRYLDDLLSNFTWAPPGWALRNPF